MKRTILLAYAMVLTTNSIKLYAKEDNATKTTPVATENTTKSTQATVQNTTRKVIQVKAQDTASIKPGDILDLSEFTKMPSGVMYKTVKKAPAGATKPVNGENLTVHYTGYLLVDGNKVGMKFDSSLDRNMPFTFKLGTRMVIPGWEISLADMKVGETRIVILPSKQAYGSRATASIPADSTLIFEINFIKAS